MEWEIVPRDEQETIINVDYFKKKISVYTTRKSTADRLLKKIGEPTYVYKITGLISGVIYERNLFDKDVAKFFSKGLIIGGFRENKAKDDKLIKENENNSTEQENE